MDCFSAKIHGCLQNKVTSKIGILGRCRTQTHSVVSLADMSSALICVRINGNGLHAQATGRADDTASDFAAIGNQQSFEHVSSPEILLARKTSLQNSLSDWLSASFGYTSTLVKTCGQPTAPKMIMDAKKRPKAMGANTKTKIVVRHPAENQFNAYAPLNWK